MAGRVRRSNEGGATHFLFDDSQGRPCALSESSAAEERAIWLGLRGGDGQMHLTQELVAELLPFLTDFARTGELPEE